MFCYLTHSWAELSSQFGVLGGAEELLCTSGEMRMLSRSKGETTSASEITPQCIPDIALLFLCTSRGSTVVK